jgi:hypothetical protein
MKNFIYAALSCFLLVSAVSAQQPVYNYTIYAGFSPQQKGSAPDLIVNRLIPLDEFSFNLKNVRAEFHAGVRKIIPFQSPFYGTVGFEFAQKQETYSMLFSYASENRASRQYDLYTVRNTVTIPVGVGVKLGRLDVTSGWKAQFVASSSLRGDMTMDIKMDRPRAQLGWYTGAAISFDRFRIGVTYQSMLSRDGNYLQHQGNALELMSVPGSFNVNIGYSF